MKWVMGKNADEWAHKAERQWKQTKTEGRKAKEEMNRRMENGFKFLPFLRRR